MKNSASTKTGARGPGARRILRAVAATTLLLPLLLTAGCGLFGGDDDENPTFPIQPPPPSMPWFFDVYGTAADRVYVGGNSGVMYRYNGSEWVATPSGTNRAITCIWGTGDGVLYACGHGGLIMRNTGGDWSVMESGTQEDLYALGSYQARIHAVGRNGAARRLSGSSWEALPTTMVIRNPLAGNTASDTLDMGADVASLLTVNHYFIGGAYRLPDYDGPEIGRSGTDGMVFGEDRPPEGEPWQEQPRCTDLTKARAYTERYRYDAMGNLLRLEHRNNQGGFIREFTLDPDNTSPANNRLRRMQIGQTGCDYAFDFNGLIQSGLDPILVPTKAVYAQYWSRDPAASFGTGLTDAVQFVIGI